jgi:diguanylate cyclase (GGDEF)-like protein
MDKDESDASENQLSHAELKNISMDKLTFKSFENTLLEKKYNEYSRQQAIKILRRFSIAPLIVFGFIAILILKLIPVSSLYLWIVYDVSAFFVVSILWGLVWFPVFDHWFNGYVGLGGVVAIAASVFVNNTLQLGSAITVSYTALIYIILFVFCFVGLRFQTALIAVMIGGVVGITLTYFVGGEVNWGKFNGTYTVSSALALLLAFGIDRQSRINFLQSYLLNIHIKDSEKLLQVSEEMVSKLDELSNTDALTGLANRRYLDEILDQEWQQALLNQNQLTVMMIDIDYFKGYNDTMGHLAGDDCLRKIARLINDLTNRRGEFSARYGGEEFILLYPNMDSKSAEIQAQKLLFDVANAHIQYPAVAGGRITFSIGVSTCVPSQHTTATQLIREADIALYKAKSNGRNRYEVFSKL